MDKQYEELMYGTGLLRVAGEDRCGFQYFNEKLCEKQRSILNGGFDKKFEIEPELHNAAMNELKNSFRYGKTRGMIIFFKDEKDRFCSNEFYDCDQIMANGHGLANPWTLDLIETGSLSFGTYRIQRGIRIGNFYWNAKKIYELAKNRDELLVTCDTHIHVSPSDIAQSNRFCEMGVGFGKKSNKIKDLVFKCHSEGLKGIEEEKLKEFILDNTRSKEKEVPGFSEKSYNEIFKECKPTISFFVDKESKNIPNIHRDKKHALPFSNGIKYMIMNSPADL
jgi:hypothetical protein